MLSITASDFDYISQLLKDEAAIFLEKGKEYLVVSRLEGAVKSVGCDDIDGLVAILRKGKEKELVRKVVESLTTHETSFFRDNQPFEMLRTTILPKLIEAKRPSKELVIWCGAASSGQEPFSLCMLIREHFPELLSWKLRFIATDISNAILEKARAGIYSQLEVNRGLPIKLLIKYFEKDGLNFKLKPEIRDMVTFQEQNLLHPYGRIPPADLIMLRNVLIYFDVKTKQQILAKMRGLMSPSSYLILGTAETTLNIDDNFERFSFDKTSCYQVRARPL